MIEQGLNLNAIEDDGRQIVVPFPATEGFRTWFTGAGDDINPTSPATGRGEGIPLKLDFITSGTQIASGSQTVEFCFNEPVEVHDGELFYTPPGNWCTKDTFDFGVRIPANQPNVNSLGSGNINLTNVGGYNLITPDPVGLGTHDLILSGAIPVKADNNGYWDVDKFTGAVTPSTTPGTAKWHLIDIEVKSYFLKSMPMGHPLGIFNIDVYKAEWFSPAWKSFLTVNKVGNTSGYVASWLMCFREKTT